MRNCSKKIAVALLVIVLAIGMTVPALSFAQTSDGPTMTGAINASAITSTTNAAASGTRTPADDCVATIRYLENPWEIDDDAPLDEDGRVLLGTHEVTGLHEGDVLNAWDYVIDIPGHFFFDGWPAKLTITNDPSQNVITLIYIKLWNCEYTVNYYMMEGADLTADNWTDALKPENVTFTKIASETFQDQLFDKLVKGDAYEYQTDGLYVIDTYPAEIRLDVNPDNNVINVLYTSSYTTVPDDVEISDYAIPDDGAADSGTAPDDAPDSAPTPDDPATPGDEPDSDNGGGSAPGAHPSNPIPGDSTTPDGSPLPDDTTFDKDDIIGLLPEGSAPGDDVYDDFVGNTVGPGELVVTDAMLAHPVDKNQATLAAKAYQTGLQQQGSSLSKTGDDTPWIIGGLIITMLAIGFLAVWLVRRNTSTEPA